LWREEYDVIIVGGGVAGATAAFKASEKGFSVVVIDEKKDSGTPVICGEFIPDMEKVSFAFDILPEMSRAYDLFKFTNILVKTRDVIVKVKGRRELRLGVSGFVIDKALLIKTLLEMAEANGATLVKGVRVRQIFEENGRYLVKVKNNILRAGRIIGADGYPSTTATLLGMDSGYTLNDWAIAGHVRGRGEWGEDEVYMYVDLDFTPGGYAWVIPRGSSEANVGIGIRASYARRGLKIQRLLREFCSLVHVENVVEGPYYKCIPVGGVVREVRKRGATLIGDSAGLVNPINGGGIPTAIASGLAVSESLERERYDDFITRSRKLLGWGLKYRFLVDAFYAKSLVGMLGVRFTPTKIAERVLKGEKTPLLALTRIAKLVL